VIVALSGVPPFWASSKQTLAESILAKDVSFKSARWGKVGGVQGPYTKDAY